MRKILFVCTGNTCRSPMSAALLQELAKQHSLPLEVRSAGIFATPATPISSQAAAVLAKWGIKATEHRSQVLNDELIAWADLILVMTEQHRQWVVSSPLSLGKVQILSEGIEDPYGRDVEAYEICLRSIERALHALFIAATSLDEGETRQRPPDSTPQGEDGT